MTKSPIIKTRKINGLLFLIIIFCASCTKEGELARDKFLGTWQTKNIVTKDVTSSTIIKGDKDNLIKWNIGAETVELEFLDNDTLAFQTSFSVPIFWDNSTSLRYINKDSLYGIRTTGSIIFGKYKTEHYYLTE